MPRAEGRYYPPNPDQKQNVSQTMRHDENLSTAIF
jgi:hypothetical protein